MAALDNDRDGELSENLLADVNAVASSWFTANAWPRVHVSFSKLFLPVLHLAVCVAFTFVHLCGDLSVHGLRSAAQDLLPAVVTDAFKWLAGLDIHVPAALYAHLYYVILVPVFLVLLGTLYSWAAEPETESSINTLIDGIAQNATADAFEFFDVENTFAARLLRPISKMQKPWQYFVLGATFWVVIVLSDLEPGLLASGEQLSAASDVKATLDAELRIRGLQIRVVLLQLWAYCLVFLLGSLSAACTLSPVFARSWRMDIIMLDAFKFESSAAAQSEAPSARSVYHWLQSARVPLGFELSTVLWDSVKRFLFSPCCLAYGLLPVATTLWACRASAVHAQVQHTLLAAVLVIPNIVTAFVFQSALLSLAAVVRRKLYAMKGLTYMLAPLGSLVVGLPAVSLHSPKTLVAWLRLRDFVYSSYDFPEMIHVEMGFHATLALLVVVQVLLFQLVSSEQWIQALFMTYYYIVCLTYGFGTLVVAQVTRQEYSWQIRELDRARVNYTASSYLNWGRHHGSVNERNLAKDIAFQVKEIVSWSKDHSQLQRAGIEPSHTMLLVLRAFMVAMLGATVSKLPAAVALGDMLASTQMFSQLKHLQHILGPAMQAMGLM